MSLNLHICHACNTTLSRKQRTQNITENVTNRPYLGALLKKCDQMCHFFLTKVSATNGTFFLAFILTEYMRKTKSCVKV